MGTDHLDTTTLEAARRSTSRTWGKHQSEVIGGGAYYSEIQRFPLSQLHLSLVDCRVAMHVEAHGNPSKVTVYLPLRGSMEIRTSEESKFRAVPGGPMVLPAKTKMSFDATPIKCILVEIPWRNLRTELAAWGCFAAAISPVALEPGSPDARSVTSVLQFVLQELQRFVGGARPALYFSRLGGVILSSIASLLAQRSAAKGGVAWTIGKLSLGEIEGWMRSRVRSRFRVSDLARIAGITVRSLHRGFVAHYHTTPSAYLRRLRLEEVRKQLLKFGDRTSLGRIALEFQFNNLSRFAGAYRAEFGENPSQTVRMHKA